MTGIPLHIASVAVLPHDSYLLGMIKMRVLAYTSLIVGVFGRTVTLGGWFVC